MTKYRLKLPLPGVPAGTESNPSGNNHHIYSGPIHAFSFSSTEMDNMPDFFEKVEEDPILLRTEDGMGITFNEEMYAVCDKWSVYRYGWIDRSLQGKAAFIKLSKNGFKFFSNETDANDYVLYNKPKPKVIFTTYDKVDIYENTVGSVFGISLNATDKNIWREVKLPWPALNGMFAENRMWFYYADQAREYLICNYPCLSNNEINCDPLNTRKLVRNKLKALLPDIF